VNVIRSTASPPSGAATALELMTLLPDLLRHHREKRGLTQKELAALVEPPLSPDTVSNIERGKTRPYRHTLDALCDALELDQSVRADVRTAWRAARTGQSPPPDAHTSTATAHRPNVATGGQKTPRPAAFGLLLKRYRLRATLSQEELAERSAMSRRGVSDLERGQRVHPQPSTARHLADALQLPEADRTILLAAAAPVQVTSAAPKSPRHNLPTQLTTFVGRVDDLGELSRLLDSHRLLTLTGSGGIGKTRLALEVGRAVLERFADGVWLIDLSPLTEHAQVPDAIAAALGIRAEVHTDIQRALIGWLESRRLLLLLDNCEHLVTECALLVAALLRACPTLHILATSREPLGVPGETTWLVSPLSVPVLDWRTVVAPRERSDAIQLFVDRASSAQPSFALSATNEDAVAQICRGLDGIPLAIELAAIRVRTLSVHQIAERLDQILNLFVSGDRSSAPRHHTLRAAIQWSYALLSEEEQRAFVRLAVFVGGWTLESAIHLMQLDCLAEGEAIQCLASLVDKSLVVGESASSGRMRYRLLEPIRQFAMERFLGSADVEVVRSRHVDCFVALGEQAAPHLRGGLQFAAWLNRLEVEQDNLRAAMRWCADNGDAERGQRLGAAVWRWWFERGTATANHEWLEWMLRTTRVSDHAATRARALGGAALLACQQEQFTLAEALLKESRTILTELREHTLLGECLYHLAFVAEHRDDFAAARQLYQAALAVYREHADPIGEAQTLNDFSWSLVEDGDHACARDVSARSIGLYRTWGDELSTVWPSMALGWSLLHQDDMIGATAVFQVALGLLRQHAWPPRDDAAPGCLDGLAAAAAAGREYERAARLTGAAAHLRDQIGRPLVASEASLADPWIEPLREQLGRDRFATLWRDGQTLAPDDILAYALGSAASNRVIITRSRSAG
jgi:non-specific serine/threonine protein kinase